MVFSRRHRRTIVPVTLVILFAVFVFTLKLSDLTIDYLYEQESDEQLSQTSDTVYMDDSIYEEMTKLAVDNRKSAVSAQIFTPMTLDVQKDPNEDIGSILETLNYERARQDDPRLLKVIREFFLFQPSMKPYNLDNPYRLEYSYGQAPFVDSRLNYMESGFYVDCGGLGGEKESNTLFFEKVRKWNGIIIEADPENFQVLKSKQRKAFIMNTCLTPYPFPARMQFHKAYDTGKWVYDDETLQWIHENNIQLGSGSIQCFPLYSILLALNRNRVDYLSLYIQGNELRILKTIPWYEVDIRMLSVENVYDTGENSDIQIFMKSKGYNALLKMQRGDTGMYSVIFMKNNSI